VLRDLREGVLWVSPNTAAGRPRHSGAVAQGRLCTAPGTAASPAQPAADLRACVDAQADLAQGRVQPF